ncbi:MAG: hypothetical protein LUI13_03370, partial [Lachnospiraceae bacterium]|nr:hypothetical protein [Lachnospiraceae bacterium]
RNDGIIPRTDGISRAEYSYSDVNYESEMFVNGLMKVSGGYFFVLNFNISGANTISVYERDLEVKQFTVNVLDYDEAEGKWIQSLISEHTTSSMTSFEKMSAICQYLLYQSEFKYLTNLKDTEKALILTTESVPYFVSKRWDSCTSPAALAKIAEAIGGFDYIHNCYSDYSYGTTEWSNTHFFCKVGIGDDIRSYTVCPATSTGEVDSFQYIDFNSTSNLTRIG